MYVALLLLSCGIRWLVFPDDTLLPAALDDWAATLGSPLPEPLRLLLGVALGAALGFAASQVLHRLAAHSTRDLTAELARGLASDKPLVLVLVAVLGASAEELFFRGVLQPWLGIVPSALAFAAVHVRRRPRAWQWPLLAFGFGLIASLAYRCTGTLLAPLTLHVFVNVASQRRLGRMVARERRRPLGGLLRT